MTKYATPEDALRDWQERPTPDALEAIMNFGYDLLPTNLIHVDGPEYDKYVIHPYDDPSSGE